MAQAVVVADDLTGANATGGLFAEGGFATVSLRERRDLRRALHDFDVVCASTGSRHLEASDAYKRVRAVMTSARGAALTVKRIDTTLRGNVGAEIDAALDATRARHPDATVKALVVPAFPAAGRTTVQGMQLLDGVALAETDAARDPLAPVTSSRVAEIIAAQSEREVTEVFQDEMADAAALEEALSSAPDIVVCDARTDGDLREIASGARRVAERGSIVWISVDPGPFGPHLAAALGLAGSASGGRPARRTRAAGPLLVVSGSVTARTLEQLAHVQERWGARLVRLKVDEMDAPTTAAELSRSIDETEAGGVAGVCTATEPGHVCRVEAPSAGRIPERLAEVVRVVLERHPVAGMYVTGGDVTHAVLGALDATGVVIEAQVLPLAVVGRLLGGAFDGLPVATKGGLVGDRSAGAACLRCLGAIALDERDEAER